MKPRVLLSGLMLMATLVAAGLLIEHGVLGDWMSEAWIDRAVRNQGISGELLYVCVAGIATALAVPRHIVSFLGGYAFGVGLGTGLALLGTELGCALAFYYARAIGRPLVSSRLAGRVKNVEDFLATHPFWMTVLIRLVPVGNNFVTNIVAGVTRVAAGPFLLGSFAGYLPQTLVFALAGSGVNLGATPRIGIAVLLFVVSGAIGARLYHKYRHGHSLGADVDGALEEEKAAGEDAPKR